MSLFIAQLAFSEPSLLSAAKLGVLAGSAVAMLAGAGVGLLALPRLAEAQPGNEPSDTSGSVP